MPRSLDSRGLFVCLALFLALVNLAVLFNIPVLRQVSSLVFLSCVPGFLLLLVLRLNRPGGVEKIVLSVGLSIAFTMLFGIILNGFSLAVGYTAPLATTPVLISFSAATVTLAVFAWIRNRGARLSLSSPGLTTGEKALLVVPALFPLLSVAGTHIMNQTDNNLLIMLLLLLIPAYVIFISFYRKKVPGRLYPGLIYLISIALLLPVALRSSHIMGSDIHDWFYLFHMTFQEGHWARFTGAIIDSSLSISLLPAVYQSLMNIDGEYLFKMLYPLLLSVSPLVIFVIARKYLGSFYAFIASFFFMAQVTFLSSTSVANTSMAIFFFALAVMVMFQDGITGFAGRLLLIIFATSSIVSHYSTSYIFFFVLFFTWIGTKLVPVIMHRGGEAEKLSSGASSGNFGVASARTPGLQKDIMLNKWALWALFFVILFLWYSDITEAPFRVAVAVIYDTLVHLSSMFLMETKGTTVAAALGQNINSELLTS